MKKEFIVGISSLLIIAAPVYSAPNRGNSEDAKVNHDVNVPQVKNENSDSEHKNELKPSPAVGIKNKEVQGISSQNEDCDSNKEWENHGTYVSCVAKKHLGGQVVSDAAQSNIGKKVKNLPSITPSISPSATPTATITTTPPLTVAATDVKFAFAPWENLKKAISHLLTSLPFFTHNS